MKKLILLLFFVSWKTQMPNGQFFWAKTKNGFETFYNAYEFTSNLFVNPNIIEIKIERKD